jgi:hypothetical protein
MAFQENRLQQSTVDCCAWGEALDVGAQTTSRATGWARHQLANWRGSSAYASRVVTHHSLAAQLWLGVNNRGPLTATGIYQAVARRGRQCGVTVYPHRFRHHSSHTSFDRGDAERDLIELNGWTTPQMLTRYGASACSAWARHSYARIMDEST